MAHPDSPLTKIAEGREAEIFAWEDGRVLRLMRRPDAQQAVEWQARALEAARSAGLSVPAVHGTTTVDGRSGLIMDRIDGVDLLTLIGRRPWTVWRAGRVSGELQAGLHETVAPDGLPSLRDRLRRRITSSDLVPPDIAERALDQLDALPDGDRLCHGDFNPANIIATGNAHVVIDWTNVSRGEPAADYVRTRLMLRLGEPPRGAPAVIRLGARLARRLLIDAHERAYRRVRPLDGAQMRRWELPVTANRLTESIPEERERLLALLEARALE